MGYMLHHRGSHLFNVNSQASHNSPVLSTKGFASTPEEGANFGFQINLRLDVYLGGLAEEKSLEAVEIRALRDTFNERLKRSVSQERKEHCWILNLSSKPSVFNHQ